MTAVPLFLAQLVAASAAVQVVYHALLAAVPWHARAVEQTSPKAAAIITVAVVVSFSTAVGLVMTIPALTGFKFGKIQIKKVATFQQVMAAMPLISLNFLLSIAAGSVSMIYTTSDIVLRDITLDLPSPSTLAAQTVFSLVMTEVWFYHVHRLFHENKKLYAMIHKKHHTWTAPVAIVSTFANPIEHVGNNLISILWGPALCGGHPLMTLAYTLVFAVGAYGHHSGYWSDDLGMHDLHHEIFNVNYGNAHILDYLYGTYRLKEDSEPAKMK